MGKDRKNIVVTMVIAIFLLSASISVWTKPTNEFSYSERRRLKQFPEVSWNRIRTGKFMSEFETYALDQFPGRDTFRSIKAHFNTKVFYQQDNNKIYMANGYLSKMEYPMNSESMKHAADRFWYIYDRYLKDKNVDVYFTIIPDKNYYMAKNNGRLSMDYDMFFDKMTEQTEFMKQIDIRERLEIEDYYKTDTHWRQEKIVDVAIEMAKQMNTTISGNYETNLLDGDFYGVYSAQSALNPEPDSIVYLTNESIENYVVYDYENDRGIPVYEMEKATGEDPYEMFLGGDVSFVSIENPNADNEKELILFRDSFGSSIAPLLAEGYAKTTLIDIRYIQPALLGRYVDFENADVLFLYSTLVLNNSATLK